MIILKYTGNNDNAVEVFLEDDSFYSIYELNFDNKTLSTKNLLIYFSDMTIVSITPYINDIYANKINFKVYSFEPFSIKTNIDHFSLKFIKMLEELGYKGEALKAKLNGIYIKSLVVYCNNNGLNILKEKINFDYVQI